MLMIAREVGQYLTTFALLYYVHQKPLILAITSTDNELIKLWSHVSAFVMKVGNQYPSGAMLWNTFHAYASMGIKLFTYFTCTKGLDKTG